jgi:phosphoglucosamine mutase
LRAAYGLATVLTGGVAEQLRKRPLVVSGQDNRLSSPMLAAAVQSGLNLGGCDVLALGIVPTPVVTLMLLKQRAVGGVMITASHNPVGDNGVKFFGSDGFKLDDALEAAIEAIIDDGAMLHAPERLRFGAVREVRPHESYFTALAKGVSAVRQGRRLRVVLDCAHGAACGFAPEAIQRAGHAVLAIHAVPDGARINVRCGATDLRDLSRTVLKHRADLGLAFDGDGDRVLAVDEQGCPVSGDKIIALFATRLRRYRAQKAVVITQMTNIGVEEALAARGVRVVRTDVGDIKVRRAMQEHGLNLGGEQAGHIIMLDKSRAGDGILAGLQLCALLSAAGRPLSQLASEFPEYPQILTNLAVHDRLAWQRDASLRRRLARVQSRFSGVRFYLRPSGTENLVRVLTEARDQALCAQSNSAVCALLSAWDGAG